MEAKLGSAYDSEYYYSHYGRIARDLDYYELISHFWRYVLFERNGLDVNASVLDYGSGIGQVTAALPNVSLSDPSVFAIDFAKQRGKSVISSLKFSSCSDTSRKGQSLCH